MKRGNKKMRFTGTKKRRKSEREHTKESLKRTRWKALCQNQVMSSGAKLCTHLSKLSVRLPPAIQLKKPSGSGMSPVNHMLYMAKDCVRLG